MPLTRSFKETVKARLRRDLEFRKALAEELKMLRASRKSKKKARTARSPSS